MKGSTEEFTEKARDEYRKKNLQQINEMLQILPDNDVIRILAYIKCLYFG